MVNGKGGFILIKENGCKLHDNCLTCPYPKCIYDTQGEGIRDIKRKERNAQIRKERNAQIRKERNTQIREKWDSGAKVEELALEYNVTERTIFRIIKAGVYANDK